MKYKPETSELTSVNISGGLVGELNNFIAKYADIESIVSSNLTPNQIQIPSLEIINEGGKAKIVAKGYDINLNVTTLYEVEFKTWQYANNTFDII